MEPKSTVTDANVFNDPSSYRAFIARVYAGLAVSGQQGAAGRPDIQGIDEGFSQYLRLYWEAQELPTDEAVIGWNDVGLPEMNTQTWAVDQQLRRRDVLPDLLPGRHGERVPAPDDRREARRSAAT